MKLPLAFIESLFEKLEPDRFQSQFLKALMQVQNVQRGSVWIRQGDAYVCSEAEGPEAAKIRGRAISVRRPSIVGTVFETGRVAVAEAGKDPRHFKEAENGLDVKSTLILCFPLKLKDGTVYGAVQIIDTSAVGNRLNLDADYLELLEGLVTTGGIALSASLALADQRQQNVELKRMLEEARSPSAIVGRSEKFVSVMRIVETYARNDFPVMITGESGTGKELVAREIHRLSRRGTRPFLTQNCSAIPDTLLESELFGYRKGAFTGAAHDKIGLFEAARGGTVFLDEIGDMALALQAKILHVLQSGEIKPLGGTEFRKADMRVVAATNRNLLRRIEAGAFREDLYFRLNVLPLEIPPLRERASDIPLLLTHFLRRFDHSTDRRRVTIAPDAMGRLTAYHWPGNIREMENLVKYLLTVSSGDVIQCTDLPPLLAQSPCAVPAAVPPREEAPSVEPSSGSRWPLAAYTWDTLERDYMLSLLEAVKWNIAAAARQAGVKRSTFTARMVKRGIRKSGELA
jgi:two-component system, NtrC family, nitrogen regulation response regulator GlnG